MSGIQDHFSRENVQFLRTGIGLAVLRRSLATAGLEVSGKMGLAGKTKEMGNLGNAHLTVP